MTELANAKDVATRRGFSILDDIAGTVAADGGTAAVLLDEACKDTWDWGCILMALGSWDSSNENLNDAFECIANAVETYCQENG